MLWKRAAGQKRQKRQKRQKLFSDRELLNRVRRLPRDEDGAALFLTALAMVVLLGFAALVTDVAILYLNRISLSNAVDAAALAGVQELPTSAWAAERRALEYGERNGVPVGMTVWVWPNREQITVEAKRVVDFFFARVLGLTETEVSARATARVGSVRAYGGAVPLAVVEQEFEYGKQYLLKVGPQTNPDPTEGISEPSRSEATALPTTRKTCVKGTEGCSASAIASRRSRATWPDRRRGLCDTGSTTICSLRDAPLLDEPLGLPSPGGRPGDRGVYPGRPPQGGDRRIRRLLYRRND